MYTCEWKQVVNIVSFWRFWWVGFDSMVRCPETKARRTIFIRKNVSWVSYLFVYRPGIETVWAGTAAFIQFNGCWLVEHNSGYILEFSTGMYLELWWYTIFNIASIVSVGIFRFHALCAAVNKNSVIIVMMYLYICMVNECQLPILLMSRIITCGKNWFFLTWQIAFLRKQTFELITSNNEDVAL